MRALAAAFGAAVQVRNHAYDRGWLRVRRLQGSVVSVGNLSVGGSGKTPFVILLGEQLTARGIPFDVLTRGYGRDSHAIMAVEATGDARQFGDEPLLIARRLQAPVIVGTDRYLAGQWAEQSFGPRLHLLDDAFQHRQLARDFDLVMVTLEDAVDRLLPWGRLREPLVSLRRADAVVLPAEAPAAALPLADKPIWRIRRGICASGVPPRPLAFCGIARPQRFLAELRQAGIEPAAELIFRDHHPYSEADIEALLTAASRARAEGFVTTGKDALNLGRRIERLQPLVVAQVTMELVDAGTLLSTMLRTIEERRQCRV